MSGHSTDPLYRDVALDHVTTIPVLGIPVRFASNAAEVTALAEEVFAAWRVLDGRPELRESEGVRARFILHEGDEGRVDDAGGAGHVALRYRMPDARRVLLMTPGSMGLADPDRREALAYVTAELVGDRQHFRYGVLEALVLAVLTQLDRRPFHAAALVRNGAALLLAGPSGVGKSTLTYAGMRAGLRVLAEDTVNLQLEPTPRVWGMPGYLHLPPDARSHFPELADRKATLMANGKEKLAIDLKAIDAVAALPVAERAGLCVLAAGAPRPTLERIDAATVEAALTAVRETGFDVFEDTVPDVVRRLAPDGGWRLRLSDDPAAAVPLLSRMFDALEGA